MHLITSLIKNILSLIIKPERELWVTGSWQLKLSRVVFPSITWLSKSWPSWTRSVELSCQNCLNISIPGFSGQFVRSLGLPLRKLYKGRKWGTVGMIQWTFIWVSEETYRRHLSRCDCKDMIDDNIEKSSGGRRYGVMWCASCLSVAIKLC